MFMFSSKVTVALASLGSLTRAAASTFTSTTQAGAVFDGVLPYGGLVSGAGGTLTVPAVSLPASADPHQVYSGSAAVGMNGWKCPGAFVSAGVIWTVRNKTVTYTAYLSNGSLPYNQSTVTVSRGDQVSLYAEVFGGGGTAQANIENLTTGKKQSVYFPVYNYNSAACNRTANWVVAENVVSNKQAPFAAFNFVNFTNAAYDSFDPVNGWVDRGLTNVTNINLVSSSNKVIAAGSTPNSSTVKVTYRK